MAANWLKPNKDKTELLWVRIRHSLCQQGCCLPVLQLNSDIIAACDNVCLLGVTFSSDLSLDWHVFIVSVSCFHWLRQLQSFDIHWQWNLRLHSSIHSQCHTSITVMLSWRMRRKPERSGSCQRHFLQTRKSFLFAVYWYVQRIKGFMTMHYINQCLFIYLPVSIMAIGVVQRDEQAVYSTTDQPGTGRFSRKHQMTQLVFSRLGTASNTNTVLTSEDIHLSNLYHRHPLTLSLTHV